jgi:hypothetical protein
LSYERFAIPEMFSGGRTLAGETTFPIEDALFELRARSARLRAALRQGDFQQTVASDADAAVGYRLWQWHGVVNGSAGPVNWRRWVLDTVAVESDLHAGSAGEVDEHFYGMVHGYMDRHAAPQHAVDAVCFIEGLARWDYALAARCADSLLQEAREGRAWVPPRMLLDGGVMAKLSQGDVQGARALRDALKRHSARPVDDLRERLLDAYLRRPQAVALQVAVATRWNTDN